MIFSGIYYVTAAHKTYKESIVDIEPIEWLLELLE